MNKKIAIFVPTLQFGGAERVALNLAEGFLQRGFAADILAASDAGDFADLIPAGVRLISLGNTGRVLRALPHLVSYKTRVALVPDADYGPYQRGYDLGALAGAHPPLCWQPRIACLQLRRSMAPDSERSFRRMRFVFFFASRME